MRHTRRAAFTLMEMLVVISVIAILIGILIPGLITAQRKAQLTSCTTNLRTVSQAVTAWAGDHDDWLPPGEGATNGLRRSHRWGYKELYPDYKWQISYHISTYLGLPAPDATMRPCKAMLCPAAAKRTDKATQTISNFVAYCVATGALVEPGYWPFGMMGSTSAKPKRMGDVQSRIGMSKLWMLSDADKINDDHSPRIDLLDIPAHVDKRNFVYFDGHVGTLPVSTDTTRDDTRDAMYGVPQ